jgi:hypothetical protein
LRLRRSLRRIRNSQTLEAFKWGSGIIAITCATGLSGFLYFYLFTQLWTAVLTFIIAFVLLMLMEYRYDQMKLNQYKSSKSKGAGAPGTVERYVAALESSKDEEDSAQSGQKNS